MVRAAFCLILGIALPVSAFGQATWHVDDDVCPQPGQGTEAEPFCTIQAALDAASAGDTVLVADGTYVGEGNRELDFAGKAVALRSVGGHTACIIDCTSAGDQTYRAFDFHSGEQSGSVVDGFTITGGQRRHGGAIACTAGSAPTITQCEIRGCQAYWGGAIYCRQNSNPTITFCSLVENTANWGGAICCDQSSPTIDNCGIGYNEAVYNDVGIVGGDGGGIHLFNDSAPVIMNSALANNTADELGGAISCRSGSPTIVHCLFAENEAHWGGGLDVGPASPYIQDAIFADNVASRGGAVFCSSGSPTLVDCVLIRNLATSNGGGIAHTLGGVVTVDRCRLIANTAGTAGAGQFDSGARAHLHNSLISGQAATDSASALVFNAAGASTITNVTLADNVGGSDGAIVCLGGSELAVANSVIWDNEPAEFHVDASVVSVDHSDVRGGWFGTGTANIDADPLFVRSGYWSDNDTPGDPADDFWVEGNYRMAFGGPCIDMGDSAVAVGALDLDGFSRIIDGDSDDVAVVDMGAYEFHCGDGNQDADERCDDGNLTSGDGCDANCTPTGCGNGIVTAGEECDDGNTEDGDGCSSTCMAGNPPSTDRPCVTDVDCLLTEDAACMWYSCGRQVPGYCDPPIPTIFGDVCGARFDDPPNGAVNTTDLLCGLAAFGEGNLHHCPNADIMVATASTCPLGNGVVNLVDLIKIASAFGAPGSPVPLACSCPENP